MTLSIAVLVSGQGSHLVNFLNEIDENQLDVKVSALISSRRTSPALDVAKRKGIPAHFVSYKDLGKDQAADIIYQHCEGADLIVLAGFLKLLPIRAEWEGRMINIHPSLLPKYGGQGFYKERVHHAVLEAGETETGCTVHAIDSIYDHGPILEQCAVSVDSSDTVDSLAVKVLEQEKILYPRVLSRIASGEWTLPLSQSLN